METDNRSTSVSSGNFREGQRVKLTWGKLSEVAKQPRYDKDSDLSVGLFFGSFILYIQFTVYVMFDSMSNNKTLTVNSGLKRSEEVMHFVQGVVKRIDVKKKMRVII